MQLSRITVLETPAQLFLLIEFDVCVLLGGSLDAVIGFLKHVRRKPLRIVFECCDHLHSGRFCGSQASASSEFYSTHPRSTGLKRRW